MIAYFIKVILGSALFIIAYKALLEKEKLLHFNRFYLLVCLLLPFILPFVTWQFNTNTVSPIEAVMAEINFFTKVISVEATAAPTGNHFWPLAFVAVYCSISFILLLRFVRNITSILRKRKHRPKLSYNGTTIVLLQHNLPPHSFLNHIFLSKADYENGQIENEVLQHELLHVKQKHSYDVLFIELLQVFFWFNPFLFLYKRYILLNHEFLADAYVIHGCRDIARYQYLLLEKSKSISGYGFSSPFNYLITKKRLVMMTKSTSFGKKVFCQMTIIPVVLAAIFLFGNTTAAQVAAGEKGRTGITVPATQEGVSQALLDEYAQLVEKFKGTPGKEYTDLAEADKARLQTIFLSMSKEQQNRQTVIFILEQPPLKKVVPTQAQVNQWQNAITYGLRINGYLVKNAVLAKYKNSDFAHVFVSKLYGKAKARASNVYQVDLMTVDYYNDYYKAAMERQGKYIVAIRVKK
jgi:bla regulator protein blaR1